MTNLKKKIKTILVVTASVGVVLFLTLIVHIVIMVKSRPPLVDATIQMARVDFHTALTDYQKTSIQHNVMDQSGAKSVFYNPKTAVMIYTFDNRQNNAGAIYQKAIKPIAANATRITFSKAEMANGCPAFDNHSFYGKLTAVVSKFIR